MASAPISPFEPATLYESCGLFEIVGGKRRDVLPMGAWASAVASLLAHHLGAFVRPHRGGWVLMNVLFRINSNARRPDLAYVSDERWPLPSVPTVDPPCLQIAPDLAVEVVNPFNSAAEMFSKTQEYLSGGVQLVWIIYPLLRSIQVVESVKESRFLREGDELDGGCVLPGFRVAVSDLFAAAAKTDKSTTQETRDARRP